MKNNKKFSRTAWYGIAIILFIGCCIIACREENLNATLGALPKADFTISQGADPNSVLVVNKTNTPSIAYWSVPATGLQMTGDSARMRFIFAGTYSIKLLVDAHGGIDTVTKTVTISQNDPTACQGTVDGFIAGCSQKTWRLNPVSHAEMVGPTEGDGSWWGNGANEPATNRICDFNDEYTFSFNAQHTFQYDNKGDFYADGYMGAGTNSCETTSQLTPAQQGWASGTFSYVIIPASNGGHTQLKLIGSGAHIGLAKVINGGESTSGPTTSSVTYDILSMTHDPAGFDVLVLGIQTFNGVWWTFTLRSY